MLRQTVLFQGEDTTGSFGLWETNATVAGTQELTGISGVYTGSGITGFAPADLTVLNGEVLFNGRDASGSFSLWVTDGTATGTSELIGISGAYTGTGGVGLVPQYLTALNGEVLFNGEDASGNQGLWITNGTVAGTHELTGINGASTGGGGLGPESLTVFNGKVLFAGADNSNERENLWVTNGTAAGTSELTGISGAAAGLFTAIVNPDFAVFNGDVVFDGYDRTAVTGLWMTDGTVAGTTEVGGLGNSGISGAYSAGLFGIGTIGRPDFTAFNGEVLFAGEDANRHAALWVTNGTAAGTSELTGISGASSSGIFSNVATYAAGLNPDFTVFNSEVLFEGTDASGNNNIWVTNGTAGGTSELAGISGANAGGIDPLSMTIFNGEVLFVGLDASAFGLWVTNGTAPGTHELTGINGADLSGLAPGFLTPAALIVPPPEDFLGNNTSDVLFNDGGTRDTGYWRISNGSVASNGWVDLGAGGSGYSAVGTGDFLGNGIADVLWSNSSTGDTGFWPTSNGTVSGWHDLGTAGSGYNVAGTGDFFGSGTSDVLWFNSASRDTGFWALASNGTVTGWHDLGTAGSGYAVAGVGDLLNTGISDVLFFNSTTRDTGFWEISNGTVTGWQDLGTAGSGYGVAGIGDFYGNGGKEVLWFNSATGDTGFWSLGSNGTVSGWHDLGTAGSGYTLVGIGDYLGNNTSDVLFENTASGDTGYWTISNGTVTGWHDLGSAGAGYSVLARPGDTR